MKTRTLEKLLLLEQSGELTPRQRRALARAADAEPKRRELNALREAVRSPDVEPDPWAAAKIAARLHEERRPVLIRACKPALALAACLALVVGIWNFRQTSPAPVVIAMTEMGVWNAQFEEDLVELESLILAISGDPLDIMEM